MSDTTPELKLLEGIKGPSDLRGLSMNQLESLADDLRASIIHQVSRTGGHLAPNLGVVELTLALHRVFDFSHDRLLFDVGHQCYPHKLLTGRLPLLDKLRTRQGMSGFPDPGESTFDLFAVGHAGTAISTATGMARGDDLVAGGTGRSDRRAVAVVGDASIVNGLALEGLNHAGTLNRQLLVVLNDNGMSISKPQGAVSYYLDKLRVSHRFGGLKRRAKDVIKNLPAGSAIERMYHRGSEAMIAALTSGEGHMFEGFGLICIGPVDGHNLSDLIDVLEDVKDVERPVLLHVKTVKGKGLDAAETDPTSLHSPKPFKVRQTAQGCCVEQKTSGRSFTAAFADSLIDVMATDEKIVAVTAAMPDGTGLSKVANAFPDRTLDSGICESHAMDMCAGMAKSGMKPFFAVYSTFSQRALDQVFQEVSLQGLPVRVCMDRAGFVGGDGAVHHGFMDVSMFRVFPGAVLMAAADEPSLKAALSFMKDYNDGASFLRYPRDNVAAAPVAIDPSQGSFGVPPFELGRARCVKAASAADTPGSTVAILAYGTMVYTALEAVQQLEESDAGRAAKVAIYDARFAKPVDLALVQDLIEADASIITLEDHALAGGFGSAVLETAADAGLDTRKIHRMGMPMKYIGQDSRDAQLAEAGLDAAAVLERLEHLLGPMSEPTILRRNAPVKP